MTQPATDTSARLRHIFVCGMSRSGTTLLAAVFDAHPAISMGYELLPGKMARLSEVEALLAGVLDEGLDDPRRVGNRLGERGHPALGKWVKRCGRTRVNPKDVLEIVRSHRTEEGERVKTVAEQARLSMRVAEARRAAEGTEMTGFKVNTSDVASVFDVFQDSLFTYILRDPRDVYASHLNRGIDRSLAEVAKAWNVYTERFLDLARRRPDRAAVVRYEDLVRHPQRIAEPLFARLPVGFHDDVLHFFEPDKASIHAYRHANTPQLRRDFFTSSVERWRGALTRAQVDEIERICGRLMAEPGRYPLDGAAARRRPSPPGLHRAPSLPDRQVRAKRKAFLARKDLYPADYEAMLAPFLGRFRPVTLREAMVDRSWVGEPILMIRHDVDHDFETARRIARWEYERSLRSTYCVLHTSWYYAVEDRDGRRLSRELVELCHELQELGHEVNFHNNAPVVALREGGDPAEILARELGELRSWGMDVVGSCGHGEALCRELDFFNLEIFSGRAWPSKGGRRVVEHEGRRIELDTVPMEDLGLAYEAYDLPRDVYVTDSGGSPRVRYNTRSIRGQRRRDLEGSVDYPRIVGILTHPIWWDFSRDAPAAHAPVFERIYDEAELEARLAALAATGSPPEGDPQ